MNWWGCIDRLSDSAWAIPASLEHGDEWLWIWNPLGQSNSNRGITLEEDLFSRKKFKGKICCTVEWKWDDSSKFREDRRVFRLGSFKGLIRGNPRLLATFKANFKPLCYQVLTRMTRTVFLPSSASGEALNIKWGGFKFILAMENWTKTKISDQAFQFQFTPFSFPIMVDRLNRTSNLIRKVLKIGWAKIQAQFAIRIEGLLLPVLLQII